MQNIFDQYDQPENRLSHALAVCLNEDASLRTAFLAWAGVKGVPGKSACCVTEQSLPGEPVGSEEDSERRGLPDIIIHNHDEWCVLIESKVQAGLRADQLRRHRRTMERRGFTSITVITLTKEPANPQEGAIALSWPRLYQWLGKGSDESGWRTRLRDYLRAAEVRLARVGYLTEGTLTMFDGFPFSEEPYSYGEAKRLLRLALSELRSNKKLIELGMDPDAPGRPAITGRSAATIWDYLQLAARPKQGTHTAFPHLTLAVHAASLNPAITIPNGVTSMVRNRLAAMSDQDFRAMHRRMLDRSKRLREQGAEIEAEVLQRHYRSQRSAATKDASCGFRLETTQPDTDGRTKYQPEWSSLFQTLIRSKRSNIQFAYVVKLPWSMKQLRTRNALDVIADAWCSLEPLIDAVCCES